MTLYETVAIDSLAKDRPSGENQSPDQMKPFDITGFSDSSENDEQWYFLTLKEFNNNDCAFSALHNFRHFSSLRTLFTLDHFKLASKKSTHLIRINVHNKLNPFGPQKPL